MNTSNPVAATAAGRRWRQFVSFAGVGLIATGIQYVILLFAVQVLHSNAVMASSAGFLLSAGVNYLLNYHFTFRSESSHLTAASRFAIIAGAGFVLNTALMYLLVQLLHVPYVLSQLLTTGAVMMWSYLGSALWTFAGSKTTS